MSSVYIVKGSSGTSYPDIEEWMVKAYTNKYKAKELKDFLNFKALEYGLNDNSIDAYNLEQKKFKEELMLQHDKYFMLGGNVEYDILVVDLED